MEKSEKKSARTLNPEKISANREKILTTALTLFTSRGFSGTPTSLISKEAGVSTGTLFFYFKTKEELIDTLYRRIKEEAAKEMCRGMDKQKTTKAKIWLLGTNVVEWSIRNHAKLKFMEQFAHSPFVSTSAHEEGMSNFLFLSDLMKDGIREGAIRNIDPTLLLSILASALTGLVARASEIEDPDEREKIVQDGLDFIWNGMKT
ncbi:TetR/AcrR family transcriptional regulator [Methanosphaerula palustris]|uniref:Transcriptional regulator, TetR family n=1 Tax=Methanosphaerula palustris (strain ATCC BAA-1556 / DSM 19958 / E1-9c) TaxID=521011 RepID=B8GI39_METPE|nr:TetR/AcrR family transcriptional regulator [Methanosphaerula palustris]ACL16779.1 transcriptional regulator, TetR family [Methanosphaerula palustris E1-9c]